MIGPSRHALAPTGSTFIEVAGHPIRWNLLRELAHSDRKVRELADLVRHRQNLVSYHLGRLRAARLVSMRRSSADGRDAYYSIDLARCGELLAATAESLHPGLKLQPAPAPVQSSDAAPVRILFLCTGNSARSQMAEALLAVLGEAAAVGFSAGSHPKPLHPEAVQVMAERGVHLSGKRSKGIEEFTDQEFDIVVTLCDRVREVCPDFRGAGRLVHWSIPDPSATASTDGETRQTFRDVADDISTRVQFLLRDLSPRSPTQEVSHG